LCQVSAGEISAFDGKKLRGSDDPQTSRRLDGECVGKRQSTGIREKKVDEKSNEIKAIPELVSRLDIMGCVLTVDTLNTQTHRA